MLLSPYVYRTIQSLFVKRNPLFLQALEDIAGKIEEPVFVKYDTNSLAAIFGHQSPVSKRPLPSDSLEHSLPCLFTPGNNVLRGCHPLRLPKPSIGRHILRNVHTDVVGTRAA
jgi:hypothetical protein